MDAIFVRGLDNREDIDNGLLELFHKKGYAITDVPVVKMYEGHPMDSRAKVYSSTYELSGIISDCFRDTEEFNRAYVMVDDDAKVLFLMITKTDDTELPEIMDLAMEVVGHA
jgi:hypothetical protein